MHVSALLMIRGSNTLSTIRPCDKRPDPCNAETRPDRRRKMATEGPVDQIRQGAMGLRRGVCKIRQQVWIDVSEAQYYLSILLASSDIAIVILDPVFQWLLKRVAPNYHIGSLKGENRSQTVAMAC